MSVTEYKTDGSRREFDKHFRRKDKNELIYLLWDALGRVERSAVETAAPRMYKALENLVNMAMRFGIPTIEAEIALAQARGETDAT